MSISSRRAKHLATVSHSKGVIFDLDGVLFDTEPLHRTAWIRSLEAFGHSIDEESLMKWTGVPCRALAERYSETLNPKRDWKEYYHAKTRELKDLVHHRLVVYPGVPDLLRRLSRQFALGYATSNYRDDAFLMLTRAGIIDLLEAGVCYDDVKRHKPHPEPYLSAAELIACNPKNCYALEDSPSGLSSARAAGMCVFAVTSTYSADLLAGADAVFSSTVEACRRLIGETETPE